VTRTQTYEENPYLT